MNTARRGAAYWPLHVIVVVALLVACAPAADRVRVLTIGRSWPSDLLNFEHEQVTGDARHLQSILPELPTRDERRISCPADDGRQLHVELASGVTVLATFDVDVSGCRYVRREGRIFESSEQFWSVLTRVSGLSEQQLR